MTNAFAGEQPCEPLGESLKVVLNNFTAHEDSYWSRQAAVNFSQMLHIALTRRSSFKWVERKEISNALKELKMALIGLQDITSALQISRWLKADLIIKGDFYRNEKQRWTLIIEVINLEHADILVRRTISFHSIEKEFLSFHGSTMEKTRGQIGIIKEGPTQVHP
jgi:curli biogenesis system outer membrane secretion channel CsgG